MQPSETNESAENTVEFQYEAQKLDDVLQETEFQQEFKQIFERFIYNESKRATTDNASMPEVNDDPDETQEAKK